MADTRTKIKGDRSPIIMEAGGGHGGFGGGHGGFGRGGVEVLGGYPYPCLDYPDDGSWQDGYYPATVIPFRRRPLMNAELNPYYNPEW